MDEEETDYFVKNEVSKFRKRQVVENSKLDRVGKKRLAIQLEKVHTTGSELLDDFRRLNVSETIISDLHANPGIQMNVMASELLSGDLFRYVEEKNDSVETPRLISEVFGALSVMVKEGVVHGDLHLGNVLLRKDYGGSFTAVIHDFGESRTADVDPKDHVDDILFFLHALAASLGENYENSLVECKFTTTKLQVEETGEAVTNTNVVETIKSLRRVFYNMYISLT